MFVIFTVEGSSLPAVVRRIARNVNSASRNTNAGMAEMFRDSERYLGERWRTNFDTEGSIYGAWEHVHPSSEQGRTFQGSSHTLVDTGALMNRFFNQTNLMGGSRLANASIWRFDNRNHALTHHFGMDKSDTIMIAAPNGDIRVKKWHLKVPSRPLVGVNAADQAAVADTVRRHARKFVHIATT